VLVEVADRLAASTPPGGTAALIDGDEFAVLLPGADATAADRVAGRFLRLLDAPMPVHGHLLTVRASVGIVDSDPQAAELLLRHADAEMYRAKREARAFGERQMSSSS
jgi:diguanylate cyclase (GGDEF)-like protein